ncbi:MAG: hypothetical protein GDA38_26955 [Hormoscilla sp. SP12CHS1]|nr:hypothetical protein [Hormoscilla sp. SP12CHS1]
MKPTRLSLNYSLYLNKSHLYLSRTRAIALDEPLSEVAKIIARYLIRYHPVESAIVPRKNNSPMPQGKRKKIASGLCQIRTP